MTRDATFLRARSPRQIAHEHRAPDGVGDTLVVLVRDGRRPPPGFLPSARARGFPTQAAHRRRQALRRLLFVSLRLLLRRLLIRGRRRPRPAGGRLRPANLLHANLVRQHLPNVRGERPTLRRVRRVRRGGRLAESGRGRGRLGVSAEPAGVLRRRRSGLDVPRDARAEFAHAIDGRVEDELRLVCASERAEGLVLRRRGVREPRVGHGADGGAEELRLVRFHEIRRHGSNLGRDAREEVGGSLGEGGVRRGGEPRGRARASRPSPDDVASLRVDAVHLGPLRPVEVPRGGRVAHARVHRHRRRRDVREEMEVPALERAPAEDVRVADGGERSRALRHGGILQTHRVHVFEQTAEEGLVVAEGGNLRVQVGVVRVARLATRSAVGDVAGQQRFPHAARLHGEIFLPRAAAAAAADAAVDVRHRQPSALLREHLQRVEARANVPLGAFGQRTERARVRGHLLLGAHVPQPLVESRRVGRGDAENLGNLAKRSQRRRVRIVAHGDDRAKKRPRALLPTRAFRTATSARGVAILPLVRVLVRVVVLRLRLRRLRLLLPRRHRRGPRAPGVDDGEKRRDRPLPLRAARRAVDLVDHHAVGSHISDHRAHLRGVEDAGGERLRAPIVRRVHLHHAVPGVSSRDVRQRRLTHAGRAAEQKNLMLGTAVLVEGHVRRRALARVDGIDAAATAGTSPAATAAAATAAAAAATAETNVPRGFRRRALEHHPVPRLEPVQHLAVDVFGGEELGEGFRGVFVHPQRGGVARGVRVLRRGRSFAGGSIAEKRSRVELRALLQALGLGEHLSASRGFDAIEHGADGFGEERASRAGSGRRGGCGCGG